MKNSCKCSGLGLLSCWQLWFHEKNWQKKIWVKNSWKCWGFWSKLNFWTKNWLFEQCLNLTRKLRTHIRFLYQFWNFFGILWSFFFAEWLWTPELIVQSWFFFGSVSSLCNWIRINNFYGKLQFNLKSHFLSKNSSLISREKCQFFLVEKLVKMMWFCTS